VTVTAAILGLTGKYGMTSGKVSGLLVITVLSCLTAGLVHFMSRPSRSSRPGRLRVLLRLAVAWVTGWLVVAAIVLGAIALLVYYGLTHMTVDNHGPRAAPWFTVCVTPEFGCDADMESRPTQIILTGSNLETVRNLVWSGWGTATATGRGTLEINNCRPDCLHGRMTGYPAMITLTKPTPIFPYQHAYADMVIASPTSALGTKSYTHLLPETN